LPDLFSDPRAEYSRRLEAHLKISEGEERNHRRFGNFKLAVIAAGIAVAWLALHSGLFSAYWIFLPVALYALLAILHERTLSAQRRAESAAEFYRRGIGRIEDRWSGTGSSGERFRDPKHVYSEDLDIFGAGCLFELLSTARLPMGEEFLAKWLSSGSPVADILERQSVVADLRDKLDLREQLAMLGEDLRVRLDPASLCQWAEEPPVLPAGPWRIVCALLAAAFVVALCYYLGTTKIWAVLIAVLFESALYRWLKPRAVQVVTGIGSNAEALILFAQILERLERETFSSQRLQKFSAQLKRDGEPASEAIRRLARIGYWIDARGGLIAKMLELPCLYTVQVGLAAESWRRRYGRDLRTWVAITGEVEALISLAAYCYEHPADPFPEFVDAAGVQGGAQPVFDGDELGHPLIPAAKCVRNSVRLNAETRVLLVSGSNMSGKSTFLRTAGINAVLAMAGGPVRGKSLRMTPFTLGSSIRRVDSLQENRSSFYTEILRIRDVFELTEGSAPVFFLFDELMEGTNSNDRKIGADGLFRALLEKRAVGIVTTHDLALTEITGSLSNVVRNVHFQDYVEDGKMRFDHKLRDGVVAKSNALELMRLIGLKV
jgi:MutS domain V